MKFIKENSTLLFICITLLAAFIIYALISNNKTSKDEINTYVEGYNYLHDYKVNEVVPVYVTDKDMATKYLSNYINLLINDKKTAYNLLDLEYKSKKFPNYESFTYYLNDLLSAKFLSCKVISYAIKSKNGYKYYYVNTSSGSTIIFKEKGIMNYLVLLDEYTVK